MLSNKPFDFTFPGDLLPSILLLDETGDFCLDSSEITLEGNDFESVLTLDDLLDGLSSVCFVDNEGDTLEGELFFGNVL